MSNRLPMLRVVFTVFFVFHGWALFTNLAIMSEVFIAIFAYFPSGFQQFIGMAEVVGAVGLILPWASKIAR